MYRFLYKKTQFLNFSISLTKIFIITFVSVYLIGNFNPYFEGADSYSYAITAKDFSQGKFFYTNEFLFSGEEEFFPHDMLKINDGKHAIYAGPIGFFGLTTVSYILGGNYGLFYFGPIAGIIMLTVTERISTNLFGKYVGLFTLLFLSTNHLFFRSALNLQTESVHTLCFLVACYFLIKFFKTNNNGFLIGSSTLFVFATLLRTNGVIYFPIEFILLAGFFIIIKVKPKVSIFQINYNSLISKKFSSNTKKKLFKIFFLALIPWMLFFAFYFSYHAYFFDDPFTNRVVLRQGDENTDVKLPSLFTINEKNYENVKQFSKYILPYQLPRIVDTSPELFLDMDYSLGKNWIGMLGLFSLFSFLAVSLWKKNNRLSIIIFTSMILVTIWFFSSVTTESRALRGVPGRYMFPAFSLYGMILGIMLVNFLKFPNKKKLIPTKILTGTKLILVTVLIIFFISSFYFSPPIQAIYNNNFHLQNPYEFDKRYPLDKEGLSENDILISINFEAMDYGFIQFKSLVQDKHMSQKSLDLLKNTLKNNYDVYTLKNPYDYVDKNIYHDIAKHPDFVLIDFSNSFCKVELISEINDLNKLKNDSNCLGF